MTNANDNRVLSDYLSRRLERLARCNAELEIKLSDDRLELLRQMEDGRLKASDPAIGKIMFHLDYVIGNTFRYTMLVAVCSFLEEAIKTIARRSSPAYDRELKVQRKGNWLQKHIRLLSDNAALEASSIRTDLDKFNDVITIRNCIIHAWGKVAEAHNPAAVRVAVERLSGAEITKDGYLLLDDQVVTDAMISADNVVEGICIQGLTAR